MPRHDIAINLPTKPIKNADTTIEIWSNNEKLGELRISRGTLDWVPRGGKRPRRVAWEDLAAMLEDPGATLRALAQFKKKQPA